MIDFEKQPKPTCATCKYYRPFSARDGDCAVAIQEGYYSHVYASDPACFAYKPQESTPQKTKKMTEEPKHTCRTCFWFGYVKDGTRCIMDEVDKPSPAQTACQYYHTNKYP